MHIQTTPQTPPTEITTHTNVATQEESKSLLSVIRQDIAAYTNKHTELSNGLEALKKDMEPLQVIEHKIQHLEELIDNKINEELLKIEKKITEKIVANATKEEVRELKEELKKDWKRLENDCLENFKHVRQHISFLGFGTTVALLLFLWHYSN